MTSFTVLPVDIPCSCRAKEGACLASLATASHSGCGIISWLSDMVSGTPYMVLQGHMQNALAAQFTLMDDEDG